MQIVQCDSGMQIRIDDDNYDEGGNGNLNKKKL